MKLKNVPFPVILFLCVLAGVIGYALLGSKTSGTRPANPDVTENIGTQESTSSNHKNRAEPQPAAAAAATAAPIQTTNAPSNAGAAQPNDPDAPAPMNPNFRLRPFAVVKFTRKHQWTAEDCRTEAAIRELAHNALEEERYRLENEWTTRRQLVYMNENPADIFPELESGAAKQLTVPGFDGVEFIVDVQNAMRLDENGFAIEGTIRGYPGSRFNMGSAHRVQSWTIDIPSLGLSYEGSPREVNEIVVNQINLEARERHRPPMGEPIRNDDVGLTQTKP